MFQFSLKRMMLAVACFACGCAVLSALFTPSADRFLSGALGFHSLGMFSFGVSGVGIGLLFNRPWRGALISMVLWPLAVAGLFVVALSLYGM